MPETIRFAGGAVRHMPWFHSRRSGAAAAGDLSAASGDVEFAGESDDIASVARQAIALANAEPLPTHPVGARALLLDPQFHAARLLLRGGWRDGFRGFLFAHLHGLFRLIVLARAWLAAGAAPDRDAS